MEGIIHTSDVMSRGKVERVVGVGGVERVGKLGGGGIPLASARVALRAIGWLWPGGGSRTALTERGPCRPFFGGRLPAPPHQLLLLVAARYPGLPPPPLPNRTDGIIA